VQIEVDARTQDILAEQTGGIGSPKNSPRM
jgi:hypothetical protein